MTPPLVRSQTGRVVRCFRRRCLTDHVKLSEAVVREVLASELPAESFRAVTSDPGHLLLASPELGCEITLSPRGEFEISIFPAGTEPWKGWQYSGFVGSADVRRLLEVARGQLQDDPRILQGDPAYYSALAGERERERTELNIRAQGGTVPLRPDSLP